MGTLSHHSRLASDQVEMHNFNMIESPIDNRQQIFNLLIFFRWLSLIPPMGATLLTVVQDGDQYRLIFSLLAAVFINLIISIFAAPINQVFKRQPWILITDLVFIAGLMALTGGWRSPYYLYILSPMLAAAFFFQVRGALFAVITFLPLYFAAILFDINFLGGSDPEWLIIITAIIGSLLIAIAMGYVSQLLFQLQSAQNNLYRAHQELRVLHDLGNSFQVSASFEDIEKQALYAVTRDLGFKRALIGTIDQERQIVPKWLEKNLNQAETKPHLNTHPFPLDFERNSISPGPTTLEKEHTSSKVDQKDALSMQDDFSTTILKQFEISDGLVLPMFWGNQPVGLLLVDLDEQDLMGIDLTVLDAIARQTAVSLGMMMTRVRHAKESAIQEERTRIALDLHDTISQSLFGLVYTLQGCLTLLPNDPQAIKPELEWALETALDVRKIIRATIHDMWPSELTAQQFENDLRTYAGDVLQAAELEIVFDIRGEFNTLSPPVRRGMYRICQESLTNIVHHAAAYESRICVDVADGRARIILRDNGRGFDPNIALAQNFKGEHFGLRGMHERAVSLGGTFEIFSNPGAGTSILIDIPANAQAHHEPDSYINRR